MMILELAAIDAFNWVQLFIGAIAFCSYTFSALLDRDLHAALKHAHLWDLLLTLSLPVLMPLYALLLGAKWLFNQLVHIDEPRMQLSTTSTLVPKMTTQVQSSAGRQKQHHQQQLIASTTISHTPNRFARE